MLELILQRNPAASAREAFRRRLFHPRIFECVRDTSLFSTFLLLFCIVDVDYILLIRRRG